MSQIQVLYVTLFVSPATKGGFFFHITVTRPYRNSSQAPTDFLKAHNPISYLAATVRRNKSSKKVYTELFCGNFHAGIVKEGKR